MTILRALGSVAAALFLSAWPSVAGVAVQHKPMDLVWTEADPNGFPLNPDWFGQAGRAHGGASGADIDASAQCGDFRNPLGTLLVDACTSQRPSVDERRLFRGGIPDLVGHVCRYVAASHEHLLADSVHGHVNWEVAAYTGNVFFDDYQFPTIGAGHLVPGDGDLDFTLQREDHRGYVRASALQDDPGLVLEANRYELGSLQTPWWAALRDSFQRDPHFVQARASLRRAPATVVGLLGIDTKHGAHTELHPIYALYARVSADGALPEHWAFFARNFGSEGGCSSARHPLGRGALAVRIATGALTAPALANLTLAAPAQLSWVQQVREPGGVVVTVVFPPYEQAVVGEFDVCDGPCVRRAAAQPRQRHPDIGAGEPPERRDEASLAPLLAMLDRPQRIAFLSRLAELPPSNDATVQVDTALEFALGGRDALRAFLKRSLRPHQHAGGE